MPFSTTPISVFWVDDLAIMKVPLIVRFLALYIWSLTLPI